MSGNTNFPAGFNPDDAQALVATMTAKLQKKINDTNAELANTMAVMQVQSTKASFAAALNQAMAGIDQAIGTGMMGVGFAGMGIGAAQGLQEGKALQTEFEGANGSLTKVQSELDETATVKKTLNERQGLTIDNGEESVQADHAKALAENDRKTTSLEAKKDKLLRDKKAAEQKLADKSNMRNVLSQTLQYSGSMLPQFAQASQQAETTRNQAASQAANSAEKSVSQLYDSNNALIKDAQQASDTYVVSVAASRG